MTTDSAELRDLLGRLFPGLVLEGVAKASGQRVVYFCHFLPNQDGDPTWSEWGNVVLKVSSSIDPQSIAYMQMEIEILKNLDSPHYPRMHFYEFYSEDPDTEEKLPERIFVTIETRLDAVPLGDCRDRFETEVAVINLLVKLVDALMVLWAHERKLVHRDLKPDNILIAENSDVAIIDLGIIRETGATGVTATHAPHGPLSCYYASPEQAMNDKRNISYKSDFFALGVIAYELITAKNPFFQDSHDTWGMVLGRVIGFTPSRLDAAGCTKEFADVVERMMQKEPYKRYRTPELLRQDLVNISGGAA